MSKEDMAAKILIGGIKEMLKDSTYCYVASSSEYSDLRDKGKEYVIALVNAVLPLFVDAEKERIQEAAEILMLKKLST